MIFVLTFIGITMSRKDGRWLSVVRPQHKNPIRYPSC